MTHKLEWILTFTPEGQPGREIGRYASRDDAMIGAQPHFEKRMQLLPGEECDELGWQMSFNGATALSPVGIYRIRRQ